MTFKGVTISSAPPQRIEYSFQSQASEAPSFVVGPEKRHTDIDLLQRKGIVFKVNNMIVREFEKAQENLTAVRKQIYPTFCMQLISLLDNSVHN